MVITVIGIIMKNFANTTNIIYLERKSIIKRLGKQNKTKKCYVILENVNVCMDMDQDYFVM